MIGSGFLSSRLVRNVRLVREVAEELRGLLYLVEELLARLPSDLKYFVIVERRYSKRHRGTVYEYRYLEVWENQTSGTNARLVARVRAGSSLAARARRAARLESYLAQLRGSLLKLRFLLETILEEVGE